MVLVIEVSQKPIINEFLLASLLSVHISENVPNEKKTFFLSKFD